MQQVIDGIGTATGTAGVLVCVFAIVLRLAGNFYFMGTELNSLLLGGMALLIIGCFVKIHALSMNTGN